MISVQAFVIKSFLHQYRLHSFIVPNQGKDQQGTCKRFFQKKTIDICSGIDSVPEPVQASGPIQKLGSGLQFQPGFARKKENGYKYAAFSFLLKSEKERAPPKNILAFSERMIVMVGLPWRRTLRCVDRGGVKGGMNIVYPHKRLSFHPFKHSESDKPIIFNTKTPMKGNRGMMKEENRNEKSRGLAWMQFVANVS